MTIVNNKTIPYSEIQKGEVALIVYSPFWDTLKKSSESTYTLINRYHVSSATIDKLRKNKPVNTTTLNDLCRILNCEIPLIVPEAYKSVVSSISQNKEKNPTNSIKLNLNKLGPNIYTYGMNLWSTGLHGGTKRLNVTGRLTANTTRN